MQMSKMKIMVISFVAAVVILFGGLFVVVSQKISPDEIRKIALTSMQDIFPNADVEIGKIDYSLGLSVKLNVEKVGIVLKSDKSKLFAVDNLVVKIPLWAIVTSGGSVDVKLDRPEIYYREVGGSHNWAIAMGNKSEVAKSATDKKENETTEKAESKDLILPAFVAKSKLNLKLSDLLLSYHLKTGGEGKVMLSRFVVKNFNIVTSTAFELSSAFNLDLSKTRKVSLETLVIGQFNLADYLKDKKLPIEIVVELKKLSVSDLPYRIPDIKTEIKTIIMPEGNISGDVVTTFLSNRIALSFALEKNVTRINNLAGDISIEEVLDIVGMKIPMIDANKSKISIAGNVVVEKGEKSSILKPDLKIELAPGVIINADGIKATNSFKANLKKDQIDAVVNTAVLEGNIETDFSIPLDINKPEIDIAKLPPFLLKIKTNNITLPKATIQNMLYAKKDAPKEDAAKAKSTTEIAESKEATKPTNLPPGKILFTMENTKIDNEKLNAKGEFLLGGNKFDIKSFNFKYADGSGDLTQQVVLLPNVTNVALDFKLSSLNLRGIAPFLPPMVEGVSGIFTGTVKGTLASSKSSLKHDIAVDVSAKNGEIKGVDISDKINSVLTSIPMLKDKLGDQKVKVPSNFENLIFQGKFKEDHYALNKIVFLGMGKMVEINGNGNIYPLSTKEDSVVELEYSDLSGKISPILEKNAGTKILPLRLKGVGLTLAPDYAYTIGKLSKKILATKGEEKIKDLAGKILKSKTGDQSQDGKKGDVVNDVLKNKKVDSLIKGLFK